MRILLALALLGFFFISCTKDDKTITVDGSVTDPNRNMPVANADVILDYKPVSSSIYNAGYQNLVSASTASDGSYELKYDKEKSSDYRIRIRKDKYFMFEKEYAPEKFESNSSVSMSFYLIPEAFVKTELTNISSFNDQDHIVFQFPEIDGSYPGQCSPGYIHGYGRYFDSSFVCAVPGDEHLSYEYDVTVNGKTSHYGPDSIYTPAFDTTLLKINY